MLNKNQSAKTKIIWSGFLWRIFFLLLVLIFFFTGLFLMKLNKTVTKTTAKLNNQVQKNNSLSSLTKGIINKNKTKLKGEEVNRVNILLLGVGGEGHKGKYLTDTIALVSINPKTFQSAILSIPRDLYVKIPNSNYKTKINALYTYGLRNRNLPPEESASLITKSVENITGEKVNYYVILDFSGFKKIIEILDGVNVQVENDIVDHYYPGPNFSYETFKISKGFHHLDAETALKYARVRHTKGGDFGRAHRQQQIIASAREKAMSIKILANPIKIIKILDILGKHLKTNIQPKEIPAMITLVKEINISQATTKVLDAWSKDSLLKSTHILLGNVWSYVLIPKEKSYAKIQDLAKNIFDLNKINDKKSKITEEKAVIELLTPSYKSYQQSKKVLATWGYHPSNSYKYKEYQTKCSSQKESLLSYSDKNKLFTLDDLAEKFNLNVKYITPEKTSKKHPDIVLCLLESTYKYFIQEKNKTNKEDRPTELEQSITNQDGEVLFNISK